MGDARRSPVHPPHASNKSILHVIQAHCTNKECLQSPALADITFFFPSSSENCVAGVKLTHKSRAKQDQGIQNVLVIHKTFLFYCKNNKKSTRSQYICDSLFPHACIERVPKNQNQLINRKYFTNYSNKIV